MTAGIPKFRLPRDVVEAEAQAIVDSGDRGAAQRVGSTPSAWRPSSRSTTPSWSRSGAVAPVGSDVSTGLEEGMAFPGIDFMWKYNFGEIDEVDERAERGHRRRRLHRRGLRPFLRSRRPSARGRRRQRVHHVPPHRGPDVGQPRRAGGDADGEHRDRDAGVAGARPSPKGGKLRAVVFHRNMLGDAEEGHKPPITPIEDSEFEVPCDLLIVAIGQTRQIEVMPESVRFDHDARTHDTSSEKVFVAGDFSYGGEDVINAVEDGKQAAAAIDTLPDGRGPAEAARGGGGDPHPRRDGPGPRPRRAAAQHMPVLPLANRDGSAEVELGFDPKAATSPPPAATSVTTSSRSTRTSASTATGASRSRRATASSGSPACSTTGTGR